MSKQRKQRNANRAVPAQRGVEDSQLSQSVALLSSIVDACAEQQPRLITDDRLQRSFAGYMFGMLLAYGKNHGLPPATVMGTINVVLVTKFGLAASAADHLSQRLICATQIGYDAELHTLIYQGIAGLTRWTTTGALAVIADFNDCAAALDARSRL